MPVAWSAEAKKLKFYRHLSHGLIIHRFRSHCRVKHHQGRHDRRASLPLIYCQLLHLECTSHVFILPLLAIHCPPVLPRNFYLQSFLQFTISTSQSFLAMEKKAPPCSRVASHPLSCSGFLNEIHPVPQSSIVALPVAYHRQGCHSVELDGNGQNRKDRLAP